MSTFGGLILTNRGRNLQSKAQAGITLQYTRIGVGDGHLGSTSILDLNNLVNEVMSLDITKLKVLGDGRAVIGTVLSNQNMTEGFYFREIGLFAEDPDLGEVLYCYGNAGELAEYISAGGGTDIIEKSIDIQTIVGNAENISAVINESLVYATKEDLENIEIPVTSVNNKTGDVKLTAEDVGAETPDGAQAKVNALAGEGNTKTVKDLDEEIAAHKADYIQHTPYAIATGNDSYAVSIPGISSLVEGMSVKIKFTSANTGACTLNINGLGAKEIRKSNGNALSSGNIKAGQICHLVYTGSVFQLLGEGGEYGTAQAQDVLEGKTIGTEEGLVTGTMPNHGTISRTITTQGGSYTIPEGYHNGSGKVTVNISNLYARNIRSGVNVGGVIGTFTGGAGTVKTSPTGPNGYIIPGHFTRTFTLAANESVMFIYANNRYGSSAYARAGTSRSGGFKLFSDHAAVTFSGTSTSITVKTLKDSEYEVFVFTA